MTDTTTACREAIDARFRSGNSVPVERAHITAAEWETIKAALATVQTGEAARKIPLDAIGGILAEVMDQAVANGANSVSMPDEYVAVAHFVSYPHEYAPPDHEALRAEVERLERINTKWATDNNNLRHEIAELQAQLTQSHQAAGVPDGYVLVPKELTPEMVRAAEYDASGMFWLASPRLKQIYYAFITSAPTAPATVAQSGADGHLMFAAREAYRSLNECALRLADIDGGTDDENKNLDELVERAGSALKHLEAIVFNNDGVSLDSADYWRGWNARDQIDNTCGACGGTGGEGECECQSCSGTGYLATPAPSVAKDGEEKQNAAL